MQVVYYTFNDTDPELPTELSDEGTHYRYTMVLATDFNALLTLYNELSTKVEELAQIFNLPTSGETNGYDQR